MIMKRSQALLVPILLFVVCALLFACTFAALWLNSEFTGEFTTDYTAITTAKDLEREITDLESGKRGFQLTGLDDQLQQYLDSIPKFNQLVQDEKALLHDEPDRVAALERVDKVMTRWVTDIAGPGIQKRKEVDEGTAQFGEIELMMKSQGGPELIARANQELDAIIADEQKEIDERRQEVTSAQKVLSALMAIGIISALFGAAFLHYSHKSYS
jgi:CHASE3 domain sensor protein